MIPAARPEIGLDEIDAVLTLRTSVADLPATERAAAEVLSLPVYPLLDDSQVDLVVAAVNAL